jgi:hypothetical protein
MPCREPLGKAVKRRSRAGGKPPKTRARETITSKRGGAPGAVRRRNPSTADLQDELDRRTRERDGDRATDGNVGGATRHIDQPGRASAGF